MNIYILFATINASLIVLYFSIKNLVDTRKKTNNSHGPASIENIPPNDIANDIKSQPAQPAFLSELIKWLVGTVGLGLTGIIINRQIQTTELDIKRMEADTQLLKVVTQDVLKHAASDSLEWRYLSFVTTFITTDSIKQAVKNRKNELNRLMEFQANNTAKNTTLNQEKEAERETTAQQKDQLKKNEQILTNNAKLLKTEVSINTLKTEENKIAENVTPIDSSAIATLNSMQKAIISPVITHEEERYTLLGNPITKWCKAGYYVEYNNTLRIGVSDLSVRNKTIEVNFKDIEVSDQDPPLIKKDITISSGETYVLEYKGIYRYQVTLNYIGAAGKNPFTKAAYVTVATYKKG